MQKPGAGRVGLVGGDLEGELKETRSERLGSGAGRGQII